MNLIRKAQKIAFCLMIQLSSVIAITSLECTLTDDSHGGPFFPGNSSVLLLWCIHGETSNQTAEDLTVTLFFPRVLVYTRYASSKSPSNIVNSTTLTIKFQNLEVSEKLQVNMTVDIDPFRVSRPGYLYKPVIPYEVAYRQNTSTCKDKTVTLGQAGLTFYTPRCNGFTSLGMESGAIKESQLSASSSTLDSHGHMLSPSLARLKHGTYWTVANYQNSVKNNFIQVDFRRVVRIEEVVTQGLIMEHVTSYRIEYSTDGITWVECRQNGNTKIFEANSPTRQTAEQSLWFPIVARYLRIFPTKWQKQIKLRVEFYGCPIRDAVQDDQPLGMEAGQILSNQISSSSNLAGTQASDGRLNQPGPGWCAGTQDELQYLQIDLLTEHLIKAVSVQSGGCTFGSSCTLNAVESFFLANSTDGAAWDVYKENGVDKLFLGAVQSQQTKHTLIQAITTRMLRFKPKTIVTKICMRTELYGQDASLANGTDELPFFSRSFVLLPDDDILVMCNAELSNVLIKRNKGNRCFLTRGASKQWLGLPFRVRSLLGYDNISDSLYAVEIKRNLIVQVTNIRSTNFNLEAGIVARGTWEDVKGLDSTIWATEVPSVPITGSSSEQPPESLLKQATNGDTWAASSHGIHYKPSGGTTFTLVALWTSQEFDACISSPCSNGGTCRHNASSLTRYSCVCKQGWGDDNCNTVIKACESSPCQNHGTCIDTVEGFSCNCTEDWTGRLCTSYIYPAWFCEGTWTADKCDCNIIKDNWGRHCEKAALYRLANAPNSYEGRVEVFYNNQWGTVCDDDWNLNAAKVLCKSLKYPGAKAAYSSAHYGQGTGPIVLDNVNCIGSETRLGECSFGKPLTHNCAHSEDAAVDCTPRYRLASGSKLNEGRLEVFHLGSWGTVCDRGWSDAAGLVACKSLGYSLLLSSYLGGHFSQGDSSSQVVFDDVVCTGSETELGLCTHSGWGISNCSHQRDVGVRCKPQMRLVGGATAKEGRVEIMYTNRWGTVCDDSWTITAGNVVCRSLGYGSASSVTSSASFGAGTGPIWLDNVVCSGSEESIVECQHQGWSVNNCGHSEDAGVVCA